jgi:hypothetical protein
MMRTLMKPIVTAVLVVVLGGPGLAGASPTVSPTVRPTAVVQRPATTEVARQTRTAAEDSARYAARETKAQNLEKFRGGEGIYIGGSVLALALLIVLLVVLL